MRAALLTAQKMATKLVQEAQVEHDALLANARKDAAEEKARLGAELKAEQDKLAYAQKNTADFIRRSDELCKAQLAFLSSLPELSLVSTPSVQEPVENTVANIGSEILDSFTVQTDMPAEEPVVEVPAKTPVDDIFPVDFNLSLDELKFGRNYDKGAE